VHKLWIAKVAGDYQFSVTKPARLGNVCYPRSRRADALASGPSLWRKSLGLLSLGLLSLGFISREEKDGVKPQPSHSKERLRGVRVA
jgi:hypothetical protein